MVNVTYEPVARQTYGMPVDHSDGTQGTGCVTYRADDLSFIHKGSLRMAWSPRLQQHETLRLAVEDQSDRPDIAVEGTSPLTLEFENFTVDGAIYIFVAPVNRPSAFIDQPFRFDWLLVYEGKAEAPFYTVGGCE
jgi:hypothetical protein